MVLICSLGLQNAFQNIITLEKEMVEKEKLIVEKNNNNEILESIYDAHRVLKALITSEKY